MELRAGETTYAGGGVIHWHGAAPDKGVIQFNISRGGSQTLSCDPSGRRKQPRRMPALRRRAVLLWSLGRQDSLG